MWYPALVGSTEQGNPSTARWFSLKLTKLEVPWLFKEGKGSSWASTSAELLASLVAAQIFLPMKEDRGRISGEVVFSGGTDNKANEALSVKRSSTKIPLMLVLMQLASYLSKQSARLSLRWRPREENVEADDLTNSCFEKFNLSNRIPLAWAQIDKSLLESLLLHVEEYSTVLANAKAKRSARVDVSVRAPVKKRVKTAW